MDKSKSPEREPMEYEELLARLEAAEETLRAIRGGELTFTSKDVLHPYQVMVEQMNEGALTLSTAGMILYCNSRFAQMLDRPVEKVVGKDIQGFIAPEQRAELEKLFQQGQQTGAKGEFSLKIGRREIPVAISVRGLRLDETLRLTALVSDISGSRQAEETIRLQAGQYATLLATTADGFLVHDGDGRILDANEVYCRMTGYSRAELLALNIAHLEARETPREVRRHIRKLAQSGFGRFEAQHQKKEGGIIDVEVNSTYFPTTGNFLVFVHDIGARKQGMLKFENYRLNLEEMVAERTAQLKDANAQLQAEIAEREKAEQTLRASEEQAKKRAAELDAVIQSLPGAITIYDKRGRAMRTNKLSDDFLGYTEAVSAKPAKGKTPLVKILDSNGEPVEENRRPVARALAGELVKSEILQIQRGTDEPMWISSSTSPVYKDGMLSGAVEVVTDITPIKAMEEELKRSEKKYRELVKYAPVGFYQIDFRTRKFTSVNEVVCQQTGYSQEELLNMSPYDVLDKPSQGLFTERLQRWLAGEKPAENVEYRIIAKDGHEIHAILNVTFTRDEQGAPLGATVVGYDITERKRLEQQIQDIANKYLLLFDTTSDGVWIHNLEGRILEVNEAYCHMCGYTEAELIDSSVSLVEAKESATEISDHIRRLVDAGGHDRFESRHRRKDGSIFDVDITALYLEREGGQVAVFVRDITERKQVEAALRESRDKYQALIETTGDFIWEMDASGRYTYCSPQMETLWGLKAQDMLGRRPFDLMPEADKAAALEFLGKVIASRKPFSGMVSQAIVAAGRLAFVETSGVPFFDAEGTLLGYRGVSRDITGREQAQEALRESERRIEEILESISDGFWAVDDQWRFIYMNQRAAENLGYKPEELIGKNLWEVFPHVLNTPHEENYRKVMESRRPAQFEIAGVLSKSDYSISVYPSGKGISVYWQNITDRKQAEQAVRQSEARFRQLVEVSPDAIFVNRGGKINLVNQAALELFGAESAEQVLGKDPLDFFHPSYHDQIRARIQTLFGGGRVPIIEVKVVRANGSLRTAEATAVLVPDAEGPAAQVILHDVTERKQREVELKQLNRTLKALSSINQAMVHATNEAEYMDEVCRIVIEDCGHAMTWIGFAQDDEARSVKPVASAGFEEGYLETLHVTWADAERGRGPTGTAIRTGKVKACPNMLTDPSFAPWRAQAQKRGYAASIALPLISEGKTFGALTIYSREPDPFSEHEMELLGELASDLAYGITMIRTRAAHAEAEEALHQGEARFRQLADASFEGLIIHENGLLLDINERITDMLGYTPEDLIGKHFWKFIDKKYHEIVREKVKAGSADLYEVELIHKDGRRVPIEVVGRPLQWKGKTVRVSALRDITERRKAEAALRESEARYRSLFDSMSEGFALHEVICDEQGQVIDYRFLEINEAFERLTGLKRGDVIGSTHNTLLPGDSPRWVGEYGRVALTGEPAHFEDYSPNLKRHYDVHAYRPAPGQFAVIFMDVTERKVMEETLRVNLAKYATLFNSFPLGITVCDQDGKILETNQEAAKLLGTTEEEQLGRDIGGRQWKIVRPDGTPMPADEYASVRALKEKRRIEAQEMGILKEPGEVTWLSVTAAPLPAEGYGAVVTYGDITKRKLLEMELERARTEAEQHASELNTIFNSIADGIVVYDAEGKAQQVNKVAVEILGFDPTNRKSGEIANTLSTRTMDGQLLKLSQAPSSRALAGHTVSSERYRLQTPPEGETIVSASAAPLWLGERIAGAVTVMQDVTELYRAEETQAWLASFPKLNPNPVTEIDQAGNLQYMNPASRMLFPDLETRKKEHPWLAGLDAIAQELQVGKSSVTREVQVGPVYYLQAVSLVPENGRLRAYGFEITKRKQAERALERSNDRLALMSEAVSQLLVSPEPQKVVEELCRKVLAHLDCHVFFNYLVDEKAGRLHLNAYAGVEEKYYRRVEWLDFGAMVCGKVAESGERIVAENIPVVRDPRTDLVRGFGVQAYACHPLKVEGRVIGTLSFGTRTRTNFSEDDLALMKAITDHVAIAMGRARTELALREARDELELRVVERTIELQTANQQLALERQRFNNVLDDLPAYLVLLSPDYHVPFANRYFEERFGKSEGRRCYEYLFNRTEPCEICETYKTLKENAPQRWEWTGPDGHNYDIHDFPFTDVDGSKLILEMGIDITERKQAEAELEKYHQHLEELVQERTAELANERANLQKIFDVVNVGMLLVAKDGSVKRVNDVIRRWTGKRNPRLLDLQPGDALGCINALTDKEGCGNGPFCTSCQIRQTFQAVFQTGMPRHGVEVESTLQLRGKSKSMWLDISADPLEVNGQPHAILALSDVTARKEAEQALKQAHDELERRVNERTQELSVANENLKVQVAERTEAEEELQVNLEEMQVVQEELNTANETLRAAQAKVESERKKYQNLFDFAPIIHVTTDIAGVISEANKAARGLLTGLNPSLEGMKLSEFVNEADRHTFSNWLYQLQNLDGISGWETSLLLPTGQVRQVSINASRVVDSNDKTIDLHWLIADITERKQAEAQLRLQTSAMEAAANGIMITDRDGNIEWCNPAFSAVSGYAPEEVIGLNPRILKSGKQKRSFYKKMWQTLLSGQVWHGEMINRRKDGELYVEEEIITPVRDEQDEITHFIAIKQDITSRKQAEEDLRVAYAYNRSLIEASIDPLATITQAGKIGDVNSSTEAVTGRSRQELIGTDFSSYFSDPDKARLAYQRVFETGSVHDYELEIRHKDGHVTPVLYNASVYRDEDGKVQGVFAVARDITDRRQFEAQLMQAEKHAVIGRMVGSVTHEINNPLQTIKNCLYLIQQDTPADSPIVEPLDMATSETARLTDLVGQLRELYRPRTDVQDRPYELIDILEEVHALLTPHLNNSKVQWKPLTGLTRCYINCVRDQILEVFLNISMNAIEAMQAAGGKLFVDMAFKGDQVGVVFRDTGPGISPDILPHMFEPFTTSKSSGLGLGLSISYGIVQRHGGQIVVENCTDCGASFTVWLPIGKKSKKENHAHATKR